MKNKDKWLIVVGGMVAAAAALLIIKQIKTDEDRPPKGAPQLDLENPGSQDDFPSAPMESGIG